MLKLKHPGTRDTDGSEVGLWNLLQPLGQQRCHVKNNCHSNKPDVEGPDPSISTDKNPLLVCLFYEAVYAYGHTYFIHTYFILLSYIQMFLYVISSYIHFYHFFLIDILMMYNIVFQMYYIVF